MSDTATLGGQSCTAGTNEHVAAGVGFYHSSIYNNNNTTSALHISHWRIYVVYVIDYAD